MRNASRCGINLTNLSIADFMNVAATEGLRSRRVRSAPRLFMFVLAFAFALQSYFTQTHIHGASLGLGGSAKIGVTKSPIPGNAPADDRQRDCPICQAVSHSGVFVAAATPHLILPLTWVQAATFVVLARATYAVSAHDWQSRAPPRT